MRANHESTSPLRSARQRAGLTQEQLAVKAGISSTTVYLAERDLLSETTARKLAVVLGCDPATLLP
jgi:DNA-binding XRE family transcriptional regulator